MRRRGSSFLVAAAMAVTAMAAPVAHAADPVIVGCNPGEATISSSTPTLSVPQGGTATFQISIARDQYCTAPLVVQPYNWFLAASTATVPSSPATGNSVTLTVTTSNVLPNLTPVGGPYTLFIYVHPECCYHETYFQLALYVTASTGPISGTPTARIMTGATVGSSTLPVRIAWPASIDPNGIGSYRLQRQVNGGSWSTVTLPTATSTYITQSLSYGATYRYRVRASDKLGNAGAYVYGIPFSPKLVQQTSTWIKTDDPWTTVYTSSAVGGSYKYRPYGFSQFWITTTAMSIGVVSIKGPTRTNHLAVYMDEGYVADGSAYATTVSYRKVIYAQNNGAAANHTYRFMDVGTIGTRRIDLDAIVMLVAK